MGDLIPTEEELNRAESSNGVKIYAVFNGFQRLQCLEFFGRKSTFFSVHKS